MKKNKNCHYFSETFEAEVRHKTDLLDFVFIKFSNSQIKCFFSTFVFALTTHFNNHQDWAKQSNTMINSKCRSENKKLSFRFTAFFLCLFFTFCPKLSLFNQRDAAQFVCYSYARTRVGIFLTGFTTVTQSKNCKTKYKILL